MAALAACRLPPSALSGARGAGKTGGVASPADCRRSISMSTPSSRSTIPFARSNCCSRCDAASRRLPIATIGAPEFFGELVEDQMKRMSENGVERAEVFEECGHSLALEADERLATFLREFMLKER